MPNMIKIIPMYLIGMKKCEETMEGLGLSSKYNLLFVNSTQKVDCKILKIIILKKN